MLDSQALETAIGLATLLFILSTAASVVTEVVSRIMKKRAKDLEETIAHMLSGQPPTAGDLSAFKETSVWKSAAAAADNKVAGRLRSVGPTYLSAKAFADSISEMTGPGGAVETLDHLPNLKKRLESLVEETHNDLLAVKAGLERWFDETMQRLEGAYKRWATVILFIVGFGLAASLNASVVDAARDFWQDPVTRQAVTESANKLVAEGGGADKIATVADAVDQLDAIALPVGWGDGHPGFHWWTIPGWLLTALMIMLGGPFWFDLLSRLVSLRGAGPKPPAATNDTASATALVSERSRQPSRLTVPWEPAATGNEDARSESTGGDEAAVPGR